MSRTGFASPFSTHALAAMSLALTVSVAGFAGAPGDAGAAKPVDPRSTLVAGAGIATVATAKGTIQGFVKNGVLTFRGIPYATAECFMPPPTYRPGKARGSRCPTARSACNGSSPS